MKKSVKVLYEELKNSVRVYVNSVRTRKTISAFFYLMTEQPMSEHGKVDGPKQFNVIQVKELINHVMTAKQLGYKTLLTANSEKLFVNYVEDAPEIPTSFLFL
jgi:hypothetical protein